ncbi:MAG: HlyD family secretion protein, partial [Candidatus Omnitrophica bacterium]|nr:HlyD family secretion protein [Candidatus Omnitrophota bacterium]
MKMNLRANKRTTFILGIAILVVAALVARYLVIGLSHVTTDDAYIEGRIHSIASRVFGTVSAVYVDDNRAVKKGDLLLELDPADYELKVSQAQAAFDAEKARLLDAEAGIKTATANLQTQSVALKQARQDKQRAEALFKEEVITRERHEKTTTAYELCLTQTKAAREQLKKAYVSKVLEESLIKEKNAALKISQLNLSYIKLYAPSDGYITGKSVEVGNQVQVSQPLMAVVALDDIWVVANYKETQLKNVRPGQPVLVKVDSYPSKIFFGKIDSIMAGTGAVFSLFPPENALGNYVKVVQRIPVKIVF